ncbi:hypothetical protein BKA93DRAFT_693721, partial [Sparassis latifolia]
AWKRCTEDLKEHDDASVRAWTRKEEIDTLLVFAPDLFSGVLTAFNVQSYQLLQPSPSPDPTIQLPSQACTAAQVNSLSFN